MAELSALRSEMRQAQNINTQNPRKGRAFGDGFEEIDMGLRKYRKYRNLLEQMYNKKEINPEIMSELRIMIERYLNYSEKTMLPEYRDLAERFMKLYEEATVIEADVF